MYGRFANAHQEKLFGHLPILSDSSDPSDLSYRSFRWRELVARAKLPNYNPCGSHQIRLL